MILTNFDLSSNVFRGIHLKGQKSVHEVNL